MTNTMTRHLFLYKEKEDEQVGGEFKEDNNFLLEGNLTGNRLEIFLNVAAIFKVGLI